eukprot:3794676-Amphidinium_carterae.2
MSAPSRTPAKRGRSAIGKAHEADSSTSKAIRVRYDKGIESQVATALRGPKCKHLLPIQIDGVRDSNGSIVGERRTDDARHPPEGQAGQPEWHDQTH